MAVAFNYNALTTGWLDQCNRITYKRKYCGISIMFMCMSCVLFNVLNTVDGSLLDRFEYSMIMLIQHLVHPSYIYEPNLWRNLLWWCQIKQKTFCLMAMIFCISTRGISSKRRETLGLWLVKIINTLINIYDNTQRLISIIYFTPHGGPCMSEQAKKCSHKYCYAESCTDARHSRNDGLSKNLKSNFNHLHI